MGDLTANLSRSEFACPCTRPECNRTPIDFELISAIQTCADSFLRTPALPLHSVDLERIAVHVNSGHRCAPYDKEMKLANSIDFNGIKISEHVYFWASDFWMEYVLQEIDSDGKNKRVRIDDNHIATHFELLYPNRCGIGRYHNRTHVDMRPYKARWDNR